MVYIAVQAAANQLAGPCKELPRDLELRPLRHSTFDIMWREAMMELLDQLEAENPEDATLAPKACPMHLQPASQSYLARGSQLHACHLLLAI
jgi:hypothetical protein